VIARSTQPYHLRPRRVAAREEHLELRLGGAARARLRPGLAGTFTVRAAHRTPPGPAMEASGEEGGVAGVGGPPSLVGSPPTAAAGCTFRVRSGPPAALLLRACHPDRGMLFASNAVEGARRGGAARTLVQEVEVEHVDGLGNRVGGVGVGRRLGCGGAGAQGVRVAGPWLPRAVYSGSRRPSLHLAPSPARARRRGRRVISFTPTGQSPRVGRRSPWSATHMLTSPAPALQADADWFDHAGPAIELGVALPAEDDDGGVGGGSPRPSSADAGAGGGAGVVGEAGPAGIADAAGGASEAGDGAAPPGPLPAAVPGGAVLGLLPVIDRPGAAVADVRGGLITLRDVQLRARSASRGFSCGGKGGGDGQFYTGRSPSPNRVPMAFERATLNASSAQPASPAPANPAQPAASPTALAPSPPGFPTHPPTPASTGRAPAAPRPGSCCACGRRPLRPQGGRRWSSRLSLWTPSRWRTRCVGGGREG
jgi:hypothetical protein